MTLKQDIEAFTAEPAGRLPPELLADLRKSIDEVRRSGIAKRALAAGDTAPDSHCRTLTADRLRSPICSGAVRAYQTILSEIRAAGGDFIAISPQTPDNSLSTAEKNALKFEVLSDHGNRVASQFGIAYAIPEVVKKTTSMFGADIAAAAQLPLTSLSEDVAAVRRYIARENGPVVLVGHSYGGAVITAAARTIRRSRLSSTSQLSCPTKVRPSAKFSDALLLTRKHLRCSRTRTDCYGSMRKRFEMQSRRMRSPKSRCFLQSTRSRSLPRASARRLKEPPGGKNPRGS
jgi:hypothetical protein